MGKNTKTFIIQVKGTENGTWQGTVDWIEEKKKVAFRSALELLRIMDSSVGFQKEQGAAEKARSFEQKVEE